MGFVGDVVEDVVDSATDAIGDVVSGVAGVVFDTVDTIVDTVSDAISAVADVISAIGPLGIIAVGIGVCMIPGVGAALSSALSSFVMSNLGTIYAIHGAITSFTSAISLGLIIDIHGIAYILSDDYRNMINSVMGHIAEMSDAVFDDAMFMQLALNNSRAIFFDVQSLLGREFDQAQLGWLKEMNNFLGKWQGKLKEKTELIDQYRRNPALLFNDLDEYINKPQIDIKGKSQQGILSTIEHTVAIVDEKVTDLNNLRSDVDRFVRDMPQEIREDILPEINAVNNRVTGFLNDRYYPWRNKTDNVLAVLQNKEKTHRKRTDNILDRMKYPGNVLADIDNLPPDERWDQAEKVQNTANTVAEEESTALAGEAVELQKELERIENALTAPTKVPEVLRKEPEAPSPLPGRQSVKPNTWFVGDY